MDVERRSRTVLSRHITIGPDSRRERVVLNLIAMEGDAVSARLKPQEAEDLLAKLAHARASLKEEVDYDLDPRAKLNFTVVDPVWRTTTDRLARAPGVALALRHSGYGWLCFVLPHAEARALGRWLLENAEEEDAEDARLDTARAS
jgi:hypothetical protein